MSGLVKNQIAKQLARFTKNLSPNKISVKFLKGEGELHNLELDETTLSELLELPPWIRLTKAVCNRISAKIHWTRLKTDPICLYLDCVEVNMEAIDSDINTPPPGSPQTPSNAPPPPPPKEKAPNRYGFVEKVVDGMFVQINSVIISFKFQAFLATFQMSRLFIQSTTPNWQPDDLRMTRVKDETRGEVLTFKEITWQTLRIDANALYNENSSQQSTPLRLITSHSALHITIKKRLEDCAVLSARLELLLDDILWVLTQSQLQGLAGLLHSVTQAMSRTEAKKGPGNNPGQPAGQATQQQTQYAPSTIHERKSDYESFNALFTQHDVRETSYHLRTGSIDLHLCDDSDQKTGGDGGAMHLQMNKLSVDYFPYHLAGTSRTDWPCHNEASLTRAYWVNELLNAFRNSQRNKQLSPHRAAHTHHRARSDSSLVGVNGREGSSHPSSPLSTPSSPRTSSRKTTPSSPRTSSQSGQSAHSIKNNLQRPVFMLESCFVVRCEEFFIMPVTTSNVTKEEVAFLSSDKKALYLPSDMPAFQLDFTQYYYPGSVGSAVPCPNLFIQLNPIQLTLDTATCLWFNSFLQSILGERTWSMGPPQQTNPPSSHIDIRIEALMPKIIIPCPSESCAAYKESRAQALQLQVSQVFITNSRTGYKSTQTDMLVFLQRFLGSKIYTDFHNFPAMLGDVQPLPNSSWVNDCSVLANSAKVDKHLNGVCQDAFGTHQPSQVWCISAEQVWLDFLGIEEVKNRPMPFIDAVPVQIWIATPLPTSDHNSSATNSAVRRTQSASRLHSPPLHGRSFSELLSPKRKASEPVISMKSRANTAAPSMLSTTSNGICNSDPNMSSHSPEALPSGSPGELSAVDGPPPAYEPRNESQKPAPASREPPPAYETLTHNGPNLSGVPLEEAPALPEKAPIPEATLSGFSETEGHANQELNSGSRADVSFLIHIPHRVSVQLDHFQFIFLLRLQEMLVKLQEDLEKDKLSQSSDVSALNGPGDAQPTAFFSILAQGADVNIVLPPAPDTDASRLERHPSQNTSRNASSLSSYLDTGGVSDSGCQSPDVIDFKTPSRTDLEEAPRKDGSVSFENVNPKASQELLPLSRPSSAQSALHTSGRASAASAPDSDGWLVVPASDKSSAGRVQSRTDSDFSSQLDSNISKDSSSKDSEKDKKEPKMVSILSIEGEEVEVGIHLQGYDKVIKMICPELKLEELGVINFDKYLNQKSFRKSLTKTTVPPTSEGAPMVCMRAEFGPSAERYEPTAGERGFMHAKVNGINGTLLVSTLGSMADCFEDEVLLPPMPFFVEVNNSRVSINNDLPPTLVSAPLPIPVDLSIENISIRRSHDGVFHIRPLSGDSHGRESERPMTRQESINASQLSLSDSASVCSRAESLENEKQCLVAQMAVSRASLQSLQEERDALLKTIERLQQELSFSNREQDLLQERMTSFQKGGRRGHR
ncbi:bridge-like lipid transfer protein family member 3B [Oculina patagonica]